MDWICLMNSSPILPLSYNSVIKHEKVYGFRFFFSLKVAFNTSPDLRKRILKGLKNQKSTSCISYAKSPVRKEKPPIRKGLWCHLPRFISFYIKFQMQFFSGEKGLFDGVSKFILVPLPDKPKERRSLHCTPALESNYAPVTSLSCPLW